MAFATIRLNFDAMNAAYKDNQSLPPDLKKWLVDQNAREDKENEKIKAENDLRAERGEKLQKLLHKSTSCCMQASLSFNATGSPIPSSGSRDRDNLPLGGKFYILSVDEFRAFLTYRYGPTALIGKPEEIQGKKGVVIFGGEHIELWDGEFFLQSKEGLAKYASAYKRNSGAVMNPHFLEVGTRWFWEIPDAAAKPVTDASSDWLVGWWKVWDGQTYYYYFFDDGHVVYIKQSPSPKWTPPKTIGNQGSYTMMDHGPRCVWRPTDGETESTIEEFTRMNWTSNTEMFAKSNKYSPLGAKKIS